MASGEAGRPPIGRPAWGWRPWPAGGDGEKAAISTGSRILTRLDEALVWLDLEDALGVGVYGFGFGSFGRSLRGHGGDLGERNKARDEI